MPESYVAPDPAGEALTAPEPLVATEPVPALADGIGAQRDARIAMDGGST